MNNSHTHLAVIFCIAVAPSPHNSSISWAQKPIYTYTTFTFAQIHCNSACMCCVYACACVCVWVIFFGAREQHKCNCNCRFNPTTVRFECIAILFLLVACVIVRSLLWEYMQTNIIMRSILQLHTRKTKTWKTLSFRRFYTQIYIWWFIQCLHWYRGINFNDYAQRR